MKAARPGLFIQAIFIALLGFKHEWAAWVVPLAVLHLLYHWLKAPRLVPLPPPPGAHRAAVDPRSTAYRLHHGASPAMPENPRPGGYTNGSWE